MGMYDSFYGNNHDEIQVKCFTIPVGSDALGECWLTGGLCRGFGIGDSVPYATDWYYYSKNFNIFVDDYETDKYELVKIRDGRVNNIIYCNEATDNDFININTIDRFGEYININSKEDLLQYSNNCYEWEHEILPENRALPRVNLADLAQVARLYGTDTQDYKNLRAIYEEDRDKADADLVQKRAELFSKFYTYNANNIMTVIFEYGMRQYIIKQKQEKNADCTHIKKYVEQMEKDFKLIAVDFERYKFLRFIDEKLDTNKADIFVKSYSST